jgi:hypothetical protein
MGNSAVLVARSRALDGVPSGSRQSVMTIITATICPTTITGQTLDR